MVEVKDLTKTYGDIKALDGVSFTVNTGEILGFLGPNGAGKSTTMNIITGYISSTEGTVTIDGSEILEEPVETKRKIGYLPEIPPLYPDMTVRKYLEFMYGLKKVKLPMEEHIDEIMKIVKIDGVGDRLIKNLSKGYKQRVGFAQALLGNPPVLILDEPTVGLDPKQIIEIRNLIKSLGKKHTIIFSSHVLSEVAATCDRIIVISNGKIVKDAKTDEIGDAASGSSELEIEVIGSSAEVLNAIKSVTAVTKARKKASTGEKSAIYTVTSPRDTDVREKIFYALASAGLPIIGMKKSQLGLEEVFLQVTSESNGRKGGKR